MFNTFLFFADTYPDTIPKMQVNINSKINQKITTELESYSKQFEGNPMLFSIITKAEELEKNGSFDEQNVSDESSKSNTSIETKKDKIPKASTCKFFLKGQCRFGEKCLNLHPGAKTKSQEARQLSLKQDKSNSEKANQKKTYVTTYENKNISSKQDQGKSNATKDDGQLSKKPSMKTATDVIHRILWDDALPTGDFIIGYLDRFIGVIEKPFTAFSWEDIASVDLNVLAVPKHRIQYFKYRDIVVWDKNKRMDKVFGSTGDSQNIIDIIEKEIEKKDANNQKVGSQEGKDCHKSNNNNNSKNSQKNRPNHFLCIRITNDAIKKNVKEVS